MSGNCDEESSGNAGVDTNPAKYQPVTSTSIHERNTGGNHGGYSSSNSEQSTVGTGIVTLISYHHCLNNVGNNKL
jgi:hypothetical protein